MFWWFYRTERATRCASLMNAPPPARNMRARRPTPQPTPGPTPGPADGLWLTTNDLIALLWDHVLWDHGGACVVGRV